MVGQFEQKIAKGAKGRVEKKRGFRTALFESEITSAATVFT
jgi:hypothetical protein